MESIRENTVENAKSICDREISKLFNIWEETGIKKDVLITYADQVINHLNGLMMDMVGESVQKKEDLLKSVKSLAQATRKLSKELGVSFGEDYNDDMPIIELECYLKEQVKNLHHLKEKRLKYIQELLTKEVEFCKKLGAKPIGFDSELPTEEEIKEFENYLKLQETEKNRLSEMFKDTRRSIVKMMEELQINPALDFERMVCHDHSNFVFSPNNMSKLRDLRESLKDQVEHAKSQVQDKREALIALWEYLDEPIEAREAFLKSYPGYSLVTLHALNAQIKRCKEKRSENIANYVNKIRIEIQNLWKLCKYSESQKKSFVAIKTDTYTDDLLTLHELQAENLRKYYNANRKIFELLNEWEVQFEKLKELDQRSNDPDRYHNRGGQLLMEEKERKSVEKKLPKLEIQVFDLVDEYENSHKKPFLVYGYSLRDFMNHIRQNYEVEKENMKVARKQAKDKSAKKTPLSTSKRTPCASMLRVTPASSRLLRTPMGTNMSRVTPAAKRKLPYDVSPNTTDSKKRAINTAKSKGTVLGSKVRKSLRTAGGGLNGSGRVKAPHKKKRRSKNETTISESSYGNFQEHLENREELRSSVLPEEVLKRAGQNIALMKTPIKPARKKVLAVSTPTANCTRTLRGTPRNPKLATPRLMPIKSTSPIEI